MRSHPPVIRRSLLSLSLAALVAPLAAQAQEAPPATDTRHADTHANRHAKDLDAVIVTASPLRDAANAVSRPVEVLGGERLDEARGAGASLGEIVSTLPGVQSSNFGPGVGRPVIRGMDGPRVAVLNDGLSSQDVSTVSQDHSPAVEPFLADQIEVLKGPSTLLYGSGAIGGVVNVVDGRIAETPVDGFSGRVEARFDGGDKDGNTDMFRVDAGNGSGLSMHADGVYRNAKDYDTPRGRQDNSFIDTKSGSVGTSLSGDWGFVGVSASRFHDNYGNPGEPGDLAEGERGVWLQMHQDRYELKGGLNDPWGEGSSLRYSFGHTKYEHIEFEGDEVGTSFSKNANEGRIEAAFSAGGWKSAIGLQGADSTFEAEGEESFVPRTDTKSLGLFAVARNEWGPLQAELGARVDQVKYDTATGISRDFHPGSVSLSGAWRFNPNWRLTLNLDHAERAPAEEELFADGPHIATLAYEVGNADLKKEAANQIELGLNYQSDWVDAKLSAYYNRYNDFIYLVDTGEGWYWDEEDEDLPIRQWSQADARFHGLEGEATFHLANNANGAWDLRVFGDTVRGKLADGGNLPRIAPSRVGAQLRWENNAWRASLGATRVNKQDKVAENETPTAGYTMVDAHVAYHIDAGRTSWEVFLDGNNLTDQVGRVHTSFLKDDVILPGRNASFGVRLFF
jgi:iron complex outermembrane receptor protein